MPYLHLQTWHLQTEAFGDVFPVVVAKSQLHFQSYNYIIYLHIIYNLLHIHRITCHINWCGMCFILQQFALQNLVLGFLILLSAGAESVVARAHVGQGFAWLG